MKKGTQGKMVKSQSVKKQLDQLEQSSRNKSGSTNEIQPIATDDGLTQ